MESVVLLIIYCGTILLASLAGGLIPLLVRLTHKRMEMAVSFVAGVMLGVAILHMLPHALMEADSMDSVMLWLLGGFLVMFLIERYFSYHHHGVLDEKNCAELKGNSNEHEHAHGHKLNWSAAMIGMSLHSIIAGVALAASLEAERHNEPASALAGLGTFLVIFLHKPLDSMTIGALMAMSSRPAMMRHIVNGLFALAIPLGAMLFHLGLLTISHTSGHVVPYALAFSSGTFLCISLSDLLPELHFHQHDRFKLSTALILGLLLAWTIALFETKAHGHEHQDEHTQQIETRDSDYWPNIE